MTDGAFPSRTDRLVRDRRWARPVQASALVIPNVPPYPEEFPEKPDAREPSPDLPPDGPDPDTPEEPAEPMPPDGPIPHEPEPGRPGDSPPDEPAPDQYRER